MNASGSDYLHDGWCMTQTHTAGTCNCHYGEIARLQERVRELEAENVALRANTSASVVRRLVAQGALRGPTTAEAEGERGLKQEGGVQD